MRQATDVTTDYGKALDVAKEVLDEIGKETAFGEAKPELQGMLTKIAEGLAKQAKEKTDPALVEQTREAVGLIEKYVSKSAQNKPLMDDIEASLALTERQIAREDELTKAVAAMQKAIDEHKTAGRLSDPQVAVEELSRPVGRRPAARGDLEGVRGREDVGQDGRRGPGGPEARSGRGRRQPR